MFLCVERGRGGEGERGREGGLGGSYAREMGAEYEGQRVLVQGRLAADLLCVALGGVAGNYGLFGVVLECHCDDCSAMGERRERERETERKREGGREGRVRSRALLKSILLFLGPCDKVKCMHGGRCAVTKDGRGECSCPACDSISSADPVCGTDGRTYASDCHVKSAMCRMKKVITVGKRVACGKWNFVKVADWLDS